MSPDLDRSARALLLIVLDASLRALVLAALAALLLAVVRPRRAAVRLGVWSAVLYGSLVVPALGLVLPAFDWPVTVPAAIQQSWAAVDPSPATAPLESAAPRHAAASVVGATAPTTASAIPWFAGAAAIYAAGALLLLIRAAIGWRMTRRLARDARPIDDGATLGRVRQLAVARGMSWAPRLAEVDRLRVPVTMAVIDPIVLLPSDWREWNPVTLDAVLAHEVAHAARRDALTQRISWLYRALTWCYPLSWWLHRRLADLAEQAIDEAALEAGAERTAYATVLVEFFARVRCEPRRAAWHLAMARRADAGAERRVDRILGWKGNAPMRHSRISLVALIVVAAPVVALTAAVRPAAGNALTNEPTLEVTRPATETFHDTNQSAPQTAATSPKQPTVRPYSSTQTKNRGVALGIATPREGQPAVILQTTSTVADGAFATIVVHNLAPKPIRSVVVAASMRPTGDPKAAPRVFTSPPLVTWIAPGANGTLHSRLIDPVALTELASLGQTGATGPIEVARVEFGDGAVWTASGGGTQSAPQSAPAQVPPKSDAQLIEEFRGGAYSATELPPGGVEPQALRRIDPKYTSNAMRAKIQGTVIVEAVVGIGGSVERVRVVQSLDPILGLDLEALTAAQQWLFRPAMVNDTPVTSYVTLNLEFRLH